MSSADSERLTEHYFDWAATAIPDKEILHEALEFSLLHWGNPSSIHKVGVDAKEALNFCRKKVANVLGVSEKNIFFTSGGTESDHIPLLSVLNRPQKGEVVLSAIEHPAMHEIANSLKNCGLRIKYVNPNKNGIVSSENFLKSISDNTVFASVMAVNNETGAIQPIYEIADGLKKMCVGKRKPHFHVDCVQVAGKIPLNLQDSEIDSASFSAHKLGGARGSGILYLSREINPFLRGGGQENSIRSGTENLFANYSCALSFEKYFVSEKNPKTYARFLEQREYTADFIKKLLQTKGISIIPKNRNGEIENEVLYSPWIVQASCKNIPGQVLQRALSEKGFFISTGSACSSGRHSRPVLDNMSCSAEEKEGAVRFSFGFSTTKQAMDEAILAVQEIVQKFNE